MNCKSYYNQLRDEFNTRHGSSAAAAQAAKVSSSFFTSTNHKGEPNSPWRMFKRTDIPPKLHVLRHSPLLKFSEAECGLALGMTFDHLLLLSMTVQ